MTGGLIIVTIGVLLYVSGLTTTSATNITTVKTIVDGNSTYSTTLAFQNISVDNDKALWAISFVMMIVGIIGTLVGFTFIRRKG